MFSIDFDSITIFFLGLFSVRQLIAENIDIPLPPKFRWLIYNKKKCGQPVLCRRAYETDLLVDKKQSSSSIVEKLLELDSRHIKYFEDGLGHGRSPRVQSKYFINTLEASYNENDLATMTTAIRSLIQSSELPFNQVDFVLYIKSGNQILARNIYNNVGNSMIYVCRQDSNSSRYPLQPKAAAHMYSVQFENLDTLLNAAKSYHGGKLTGIVVDCSVSTGDGIKEAINQFNQLIDKENLNINKIEHAFVLYAHRPYSDEECKNFTLHRFFDMDEKTRELIYKVHKGKDNVGCIEVYNHLKDNGLLRTNQI